MKKTVKKSFPLRRWVVVLALAALLISTFPLAGFHTQAGSTYTAYEQTLLGAGFPESYVHLLNRLHEEHPNWNFEAYHTGLNWATAVSAECSGGRSLVVSTAGDIFKSRASGCYDPTTGTYTPVESGYVTASEFAVSYYMDPRNFLTDEYILQFESLVYHSSQNELSVIQNILKGTVLAADKITYKNSKGAVNTINQSYAQTVLDAGKAYGVNPFYLASKIKNEVGSGGSTISGTVSGYEGLYNFYNIYAYGSSSITQALAWAGSGTTYNRPWTTPVKSIHGGAEYIASGYLKRGQSTSYFQRFNVVSAPYYSHQYMTAISGAAEEACNAYKALSSATLDAARTFVIPVYDNMPQSSAYLADSISLNNYYNVGVANASVNLRTGPTTTESNKSGRVLPAGTPVTILEEVRSSGTDFLKYPYWYRVSYSSGGATYDGYVCANYVNINYTQTTLEVNANLQMQYLLSPSAAGELPKVTSSNNNVATVNSNGTVIGVGVGTAYITATLNNGDRVSMCLSVVPSATSVVSVTELMLNAETLSLSADQTFQLAAEVYPENATLKNVAWSTDNSSVVTVGADGIVKAVGGGTAVVLATSADGAVYATCTVTVSAPVAQEPPSQTGGLVDLDTGISQVEDTSSIQQAVEEAEKKDEASDDILTGDVPDETLPENSDSELPEDSSQQLPGHAIIPSTQTTSFTVQVTQPDGTAAENAKVLLKSASNKIVSTATLITGGEYMFENILNGSYTVEVTSAKGEVYREKIKLKEGVLSGVTEFVLTPGTQKSQLGTVLALCAAGVVVLAGAGLGLAAYFNRKKHNNRKKWYTSM